jgi:AbrB family looped-hinge helix DNA binding protein
MSLAETPLSETSQIPFLNRSHGEFVKNPGKEYNPFMPRTAQTVPTSTISSKGQVTVPIEVRHRLGLREGDRVEFVFEDGRTFLRPAQIEANPFTAYLGALPAFSSREEINAFFRDLRGHDQWDDEDSKEAGK